MTGSLQLRSNSVMLIKFKTKSIPILSHNHIFTSIQCHTLLTYATVNGQQKVTGPNVQKVFITYSCFKLWNLSCNWVTLTWNNTMGRKSRSYEIGYTIVSTKVVVPYGQRASTSRLPIAQVNKTCLGVWIVSWNPSRADLTALAHYNGISRQQSLMDDNPIYVFLN